MARPGAARPGVAWLGTAGQGSARPGVARHGPAQPGVAGKGISLLWSGESAEQFTVGGKHMQNKLKDMSVIVELKWIAKAGGGILQPSAVVEAAKPKTSLLHSHFTWDDSEAAAAWRLWQARQLISVCVEVIGEKEAAPEARVFVSLRDERGEEGGYRSLVSVLSQPDLRAQLLHDALAELKYFKVKYQALKELVEVFAAIENAEQQLELIKK